MDGATTNVVPCGKCHKCLRDRQNAWVFRLQQEMKISSSAAFITLTYAEPPQSFNGHQTLEPDHLKNFWKRLRKATNRKIKYFAVGEYGTKFLRPHYHAIVYNLPQSIIQNSDKLTTHWKHGNTDIAPSNGATMRYTAGYIMQTKWQPTQDDDDRHPQFQRQSKNLGISYLTPQMVNYHITNKLPIITKSGKDILKMPRYYKEKIFSKYERKQMAEEYQEINKLSLLEYSQYDYTKEVQIKLNQIRQHEKQNRENKKSTF